MPNSATPPTPTPSAPGATVQVVSDRMSLLVAHTAFATWVEIDAALSTLITPLAMAALYKRALALTRSVHPLLNVIYNGPLLVGDYTTLRDLLAAQPVAIAAATDEALLQTFTGLLSKLVGPALTERLLSSVRDNLSSRGTAAKDAAT